MLDWCWLIVWGWRDVNGKQDSSWKPWHFSFFFCIFAYMSLFLNFFFLNARQALDFTLACTACTAVRGDVCRSFGFLSLTLHQQVVWQESYRKSLCGCWQACPHFEKVWGSFRARAPFSPTAAPELCLTLHTKWRLCVTNWFQLAVAMVSTLEGAVGRRRGQEGWWVCHMTTQRKCLMSCDVFW